MDTIKQVTREDYLRRMNIIIEYINNHLDEEIDLRKLADLSGFSSFHFHRIFRAFMHETLGSYITRIRVETAARLLRYTDLSIESIAYNVGYEIPSSLSKAFKQNYNISPLEYRKNKNFIIMKRELINTELKMKAPKIIESNAKQAIYIRLTGDYSKLDFEGAWSRLWAFVKEHKLFSAGIEHICIYHDDPKVTEVNKLRTDICLVIHKSVKAEGEIGVKEIPGGKYAVFHYQGSYDNLEAVYDTIYAKWLPESGYELRNIPMYEEYLNNPADTEPEKLKTELYLPIQ